MDIQTRLLISNKDLHVNEVFDYLQTINNSFEYAPNYNNFFLNNDESIGIEQIQELMNWNAKRVESGVKIAILFKAHRITSIAQNSLLKLLEEPSPNTQIILVTNNPDSLLETIRSRVVIEYLSNSKEEIYDVERIIRLPFTDRAIEFVTIAKKSREEQEAFISEIYTYLTVNQLDLESDLLQTLLSLQKSIRSQVQSNLIFDNLNIALNQIQNTV